LLGVFASSAVVEAICPPHNVNNKPGIAFTSEVYQFTHTYCEYIDIRGQAHNGICTVRVYEKYSSTYCTKCNSDLGYASTGTFTLYSSCS